LAEGRALEDLATEGTEVTEKKLIMQGPAGEAKPSGDQVISVAKQL
jgi:hypothetical protein